MSKPGIGDSLAAIRVSEHDVLISVHQRGPGHYGIRIWRGIGWAPERYPTAEAAIRALLKLRGWTTAELEQAKQVCTPA